MEDEECRICLEEKPLLRLSPCGHEPVCDICIHRIRKCPKCLVMLYVPVTFKMLNSKTIIINVNLNSTVLEYKLILEPFAGCVAQQMSLIFGGRVCVDDYTFEQLNVRRNNTICIIPNMKGD